ncbi:hypothetical protein O5165_25055, partial [Escherichia coli]|nr:hypothetical protein [Escherichia coli]
LDFISYAEESGLIVPLDLSFVHHIGNIVIKLFSCISLPISMIDKRDAQVITLLNKMRLVIKTS